MFVTGSNSQRPWPAPVGRVAMYQTWSKLLFAHWPLPPEILQPLIPAGLELDTFEGQGWVGVVPFLMSNIRLFGLPRVPFASSFAELNVRTYVVRDGKPGVLFFSLDANHPPAVAAARLWYHLPYFRARMKVSWQEAKVSYYSKRQHRPFHAGEFSASYQPVSPVFYAARGTLEDWLTARYCLYTSYNKQVYRGEIDHAPWPLQLAKADIKINTVATMHGLQLPDQPPLLHYAERLDVVAWAIKPV